jgi:hypothetical protein
MTPSIERAALRGAALVLGLAIGLALAEVGLRLLRSDFAAPRLSLDPAAREATHRWDESLGWRNLPGVMGTNRQGFRFPRDFSDARSTDRGRVAIVGDSQVFGVGVDDAEHLAVLLDRRSGGPEVYPFGVPGYGPTQMMLLLEEVLDRFAPDTVVVVLFVENDLIDDTLVMSMGFLQKPYLEKTATEWVVRNSPVPLPVTGAGGGTWSHMWSQADEQAYLVPAWWLYRSSAAYRTLVQTSAGRRWLANTLGRLGLVDATVMQPTVSRHIRIRRIDGAPVECWRVARCPEANWLDGLAATVAAHARMHHTCRVAGVRFGVLVAPTLTELRRGAFPVTERVTSELRAVGIPTIDLERAFLDVGDPDAAVGPLHWTALGHRLAADAVRRFLDASPGE